MAKRLNRTKKNKTFQKNEKIFGRRGFFIFRRKAFFKRRGRINVSKSSRSV